MTKKFLLWWLVVLLQVAFMAIIVKYDYHMYVLDNDVTKISVAIVTLWLCTTIVTGASMYRYKKLYATEGAWFAAETCMTLGMIGTIVGFIVMLTTNLAGLDPSNTEQMRAALAGMSSGLGVALLTTLTGLIASLFVKIQLIIQDH